jgi:hypothetical protein
MHSLVKVDFRTTPWSVSDTLHTTDWMTRIDPATGDTIDSAMGSTLTMFFLDLGPDGRGRYQLKVVMSQSIPLLYRGNFGFDIDLWGTITIDPRLRTVLFEGRVDAFPAWEAYVQADAGPRLPLFLQNILPGRGPLSAAGPPSIAPSPAFVMF